MIITTSTRMTTACLIACALLVPGCGDTEDPTAERPAEDPSATTESSATTEADRAEPSGTTAPSDEDQAPLGGRWVSLEVLMDAEVVCEGCDLDPDDAPSTREYLILDDGTILAVNAEWAWGIGPSCEDEDVLEWLLAQASDGRSQACYPSPSPLGDLDPGSLTGS